MIVWNNSVFYDGCMYVSVFAFRVASNVLCFELKS